MTRIAAVVFGKTTVRGVVALTLTGVGSYLAVTGAITGEAFLVQLATVIGFYFGSENRA